MLSFISRRLASAIPTLFVVVTLSFFLIRLAPGGPFDLERPLEARVMDNLKRIYQLDKPLYEQYLLYLGALLRGDLGPSFYFRDFSVAELFASGLPVSIRLGLSALVLLIVVGGGLDTGHAQLCGQFGLGEAEWLHELLAQHLAGRGGLPVGR